MVGHKLGEFALTRTFRGHIKSDKKSKRLSFYIWGKKIHPVGLRLGINQQHCSTWYARSCDYSFFVREDHHLRNYIFQNYFHCTILNVAIERRRKSIRINISAVNINSLLGKILEKLCSELQVECLRFRKNYSPVRNSSQIRILEKPKIQVYIRQLICPDENAKYIASFIVAELEKRVPFRRVLRTAQEKTKNLKQITGVRFQISGRLNGIEIARIEWVRSGCVSLHTLSANIDYAYIIARTIYGLLGVKVWIFRSGYRR
jgi:small subunit ribosomal protein S3